MLRGLPRHCTNIGMSCRVDVRIPKRCKSSVSRLTLLGEVMDLLSESNSTIDDLEVPESSDKGCGAVPARPLWEGQDGGETLAVRLATPPAVTPASVLESNGPTIIAASGAYTSSFCVRMPAGLLDCFKAERNSALLSSL